MHPCCTLLETESCPTVTHFASPDLTDLYVIGRVWWEILGAAKAHQDFPQSIVADSIKGLGEIYESCI